VHVEINAHEDFVFISSLQASTHSPYEYLLCLFLAEDILFDAVIYPALSLLPAEFFV
jgi:hypothetical protein